MAIIPTKLQPGDRVAILSPSGGLPEVFPEVFDQGLKRLLEVFGLIPVEYPTTRILDSSLVDRAWDLHTALEDTSIRAIICTIGGDDQIKLLKHLKPDIIQANPKIFMGYSDATNLCQYLTQVGGFVTYYGPAIMTQFGASGSMDNYTLDNLKKVLFGSGEVEIFPSKEYSESFLDWGELESLNEVRPMFTSPDRIWYNFGATENSGPTWGGCLEILDFQMQANKFLPGGEYLENKILFFETSEEIPSSRYVYRVLTGMGERGLLQQFQAILVGRARSLRTGEAFDQDKVDKHQQKQREAIIRVTQEYCSGTPILFNLDFGHTDPIFTIPNGGSCRINPVSKQLFMTY